jgi:hypothetical protein
MPKTRNARRFWQAAVVHSGVETAWRLLWKADISDVSTTLWELRRLDLSVEAYVLRSEYAPLFTEEERSIEGARLLKGVRMPRLTMPQYRGAGARTGLRRRFHSPAGPAGRGAWLSPLTTAQPCNHCLGLGQVWCVIPSINSATVQRSASSRRGGPRERRSHNELLDKPCWNRWVGSRRYRRTSVASRAGRLTPSPPASSYG